MNSATAAISKRLKERLERARAEATKLVARKPGLELCRMLTREADAIIRDHFRQTLKTSGIGHSLHERLAVIALGGYGRRDLCLYSDIDLLFLFATPPRPQEEAFVKAFLFPLWDIGVEIGHTIRSVKEVVGSVGSDRDFVTAMMENRLLAGAEALRRKATEGLHRKLHTEEGTRWFAEVRRADQVRRQEKHGNSAFMLEPHVKEGCGGLRDLHAIFWNAFILFGEATFAVLVEKNVLTRAEERELQKSMNFQLQVRNAMHSIERRRTDHLTFERQIKTAQLLGYEATENALAEENLMREYYARARLVERLSERVGAVVAEKFPPSKARGKAAAGAATAGGRAGGGGDAGSGPAADLASSQSRARAMALLEGFDAETAPGRPLPGGSGAGIYCDGGAGGGGAPGYGVTDAGVGRMSTRTPVPLSPRATLGSASGVAASHRRRISGPFWQKGPELIVEGGKANLFREDPDLILKAFSLAAAGGLRVRGEVRARITEALSRCDDAFRESPANRDLFLGILRGPSNTFQTLYDMHDCGALGAYLPEFDLVKHLPRLDLYHHYTVDEHLLRAVREAERLLGGPGAADEGEMRRLGLLHVAGVARKLHRWDLLILATLIHDVGKGEGRGHVIRGAHIAERIGDRMGLSARERDLVRRLVLYHQRMSHLALRRDVEDPEVARELANELADRELLRMLYVLTVCDILGVGGNAWNDWKAQLLVNLYERTRDELYQMRALPLTARNSQGLTPRMVAELLPPADDPTEQERELEQFLFGMPERYRVSTGPREAVAHFQMIQRLTDDNAVLWELEVPPGRNYSQLTVAMKDAPGMFSHVCGALASRGINILAAQIYTGAGGWCIDAFQVQDQRGEPVEGGPWLERLRKRLNAVLLGKQEAQWTSDGNLSQAQRARAMLTDARLAIRPTTIEFDNKSSVHYTLMEVKSHDRPGLLYDITRVLSEERINIDLALIATEAYVVDVFYITDFDNNKIVEKDRMEKLRARLLKVIDEADAQDGTPTGQAPPGQASPAAAAEPPNPAAGG